MPVILRVGTVIALRHALPLELTRNHSAEATRGVIPTRKRQSGLVVAANL
jgi:hypothetical protein